MSISHATIPFRSTWLQMYFYIMSKAEITEPMQVSDYRDFDPRVLAEIKAAKNLRLSVLLPALNEEATIGNIVSIIRKDLVENCQLVDEIVVADNASTDRTSQVALEAGATVPVLPDNIEERFRGKGWTLQRGVEHCVGDIVICVDSDIRNFTSRFVYGLAGPMLADDSVAFVKAFYRRPMVSGKEAIPDFGGRVTELTARPMLSLFYPELARMHQPLSGEYAFRRCLARTLPFWSGYGVETGLLIHILRRGLLGGVAEVNMGERIHRNRNLRDLGRMSFGILKTIFAELQADGLVSLASQIETARIMSTDLPSEPADEIPQILIPAIDTDCPGGYHA